jgi:hypothetical protein
MNYIKRAFLSYALWFPEGMIITTLWQEIRRKRVKSSYLFSLLHTAISPQAACEL